MWKGLGVGGVNSGSGHAAGGRSMLRPYSLLEYIPLAFMLVAGNERGCVKIRI